MLIYTSVPVFPAFPPNKGTATAFSKTLRNAARKGQRFWGSAEDDPEFCRERGQAGNNAPLPTQGGVQGNLTLGQKSDLIRRKLQPTRWRSHDIADQTVLRVLSPRITTCGVSSLLVLCRNHLFVHCVFVFGQLPSEKKKLRKAAHERIRVPIINQISAVLTVSSEIHRVGTQDELIEPRASDDL